MAQLWNLFSIRMARSKNVMKATNDVTLTSALCLLPRVLEISGDGPMLKQRFYATASKRKLYQFMASSSDMRSQ